MWIKQLWKIDEMCFDRERLESKMKPRLRAEETGLRMVSGEMVSVGFEILDSCTEIPISKNSVFDGFREKSLMTSRMRFRLWFLVGIRYCV